MQAVILAGGKGTRLRPFTTTLPKPILPVGDEPVVAIVLSQLRDAGVTKVTMAVNHMAELIMSFFGTGHKFGLCVEYSVEDRPLGTVGPVKRIPNLPEHFLVMNGDILTDLDFCALFRSHISGNAKLTVATYQREVPIDFGVLELNKAGSLKGFQEKPTFKFDVSMGVYMFSRSILEDVPDDEPYGFDQLVLSMLERGDAINSFRHSGYWLDLGRPDDYDRANQEIETLPIFKKGRRRATA
jgi:NDP-sugar pyrophosphorylase family protein